MGIWRTAKQLRVGRHFEPAPFDKGGLLNGGACSRFIAQRLFALRMSHTMNSPIRSMFGSIAERYDLTNTILSGGVHHLWRAALFAELDRLVVPRQSDGTVLDLCTGTGDLLPGLQSRFSHVLGVDFCWPMVKVGRSRIAGPSPFVVGDAHQLPLKDNSCDVVTIAYGVRNFEQLERGLREVRRILRPGGAMLILDFGTPTIRPLRAVFSLYSRFLMPLLGGLLTGNRRAYEYLPESSRAFACGKALCEVLGSAGFVQPSFRALTGGIAYLYTAAG